MEVGQRVQHYKHGKGIVTSLQHQGLAEVRFGNTNQYVEQKNLVLTMSQTENKQKNTKNEILKLLDIGDFEQAKKTYQEEKCIKWWSWIEFKVEMKSAHRNLLIRNKAEKERIHLVKLRKEKAEHRKKEQLHQENLRRERQVKRDELVAEIYRWTNTDFLDVDLFYHEFCADLITPDEFNKYKIAFVKRWIEENTPLNENGEKRLPDDEQAAAIAAVHGHIQVIARAGSGKTTTLVNRTLFLIKHCGVTANEMLLLAFNRKAALEIRRRLLRLFNNTAEIAVKAEIHSRTLEKSKSNKIDYSEIEANAINAVAEKLNIPLPHIMTFHALAYAIVHPEESILYDGAEGESQSLSRTLQEVINDHLEHPEFKNKICNMMLAHFRNDWERIVDGGYDNRSNKEEFLQFRRSLTRESLNGDYVKSFGEKLIANFLFEHEIPYKYERNHYWSGINYRPDFTIFQTAKMGIIIEYFGLQGDADYDEMTQQKRDYWQQKNNWTLVEIFPHNITENGEERFTQILKDYFLACGFPCIKLSEDEIWRKIKDRAIDQFTRAIKGFVGRCRKQSLSVLDLQNLIAQYTPILDVETMFHELAYHFHSVYLDKLAATGQDDFDGLMQKSANLINAGKTRFERKSGGGDFTTLRYICIDEFQDFSELFYRLLEAIRAKNPKVELFCVGDDWQAINGFTGSDLRFFEKFKDHVGESKQLYISTNYRSSQIIVNIGNDLMTGHGKPAVATKKEVGEIVLVDLQDFKPSLPEQQRHSGDIITPVVLRLINKALSKGLNVVMLCRRNAIPWYVNRIDEGKVTSFGLDSYVNFIRSFFPDTLKDKITISTVHKYKGLEKPMVIVMDAIERSYPLIHPNWIFSRILGDSPEKITEEERRLFYVALTRAIKKLVIITEGKRKSAFLQKLQVNDINWLEYPPVSGEKSCLVVKVKNQASVANGSGTFSIKDLLNSLGYRWESTSKTWAKSFLSDGFNIETLKNEIWAKSANGIEVHIVDETEKLLKCFLVDGGEWSCVS